MNLREYKIMDLKKKRVVSKIIWIKRWRVESEKKRRKRWKRYDM